MKKTRSKKIILASIWTCVGLISILIIGMLIIGKYVPILLKNKISQLVVEGSDSLYKCSVGKVSVNFWLSKVTVEDIYISVDSTKYWQLQKKDSLPNITFEMDLKKASITKLKILPILLSKKIFIEALHINRTDVIFCLHPHKDRLPPKPQMPFWRMIEPIAKGIYINNIVLDNIKLAYSPLEDKKNISFSYQDGSISLQNIRVDSAGAASRSRILYTENITIQLAGIKYYTPDSLYLLNIDTFSYSSIHKNLKLKLFELKPTLSLIEFTKKNGMQVDAFNIVIPELAGANFKIERIFTGNEVSFDSILIKKPILKISRDRTAHYDTTSQIDKYPNEALLKAPFTLRIPMVIIEEAELHYIERQKLTLKTGDAYFKHINGYISNITNSTIDLEKNGHCNMDLNGIFMKQGKLKIHIDFDLLSPEGNYGATAHLGPMTSIELNPVFIPFANIKLKTFTFNEGYLNIMGNSMGVKGSARLLYENLNIEILAINKKTHKTKKRGFVSFLANLIAVRMHNKAGINEIIADQIYVVRKRRQPFGNLMWEFVFESMKKIILKVPAKDLKVEM